MSGHPSKSPWSRVLLYCGLIGPPLFIVAFLIEGALKPDYEALRYPVSSLSVGAAGWAQQANFIVSGLLILAFAAGLRRNLCLSPAGTWGPFLIALVGTGLVGAGAFSTDPVFGYPASHPLLLEQVTYHGRLHDLFSIFVFLGLPAACFVFVRRFAVLGQNSWMIYSMATGIAMPILFVVTAVGFRQAPGLGAFAGLFQRLTIGVGWLWLVLLALHRLRAGVGSG